MDRPGDHLLARPRLARDEDAGHEPGDVLDRGEDFKHGWIHADHTLEDVFLLGSFFELERFPPQVAFF
jgi:hypothetical protein